VVVLERGNESVVSVNKSEALRKVRNLNRYEFNYHRAPAAISYEFFNPELDLAGACAAEQAILGKLIDSAPELLVIRSADATRYAELLIQSLTSASRERMAA
jgi:hypothetical protein